MAKRYFMYLYWSPHRGQTEENPDCACGTGCYIAELPLKDINPNCVYTSEKRAARQAEKLNTLYGRTKVIEVTDYIKKEETA